MIQFKRGDENSWKTTNAILGDGQPGVIRRDDGSYYLKIGKNVHAESDFNNLRPLSASPLVDVLSTNESWSKINNIYYTTYNNGILIDLGTEDMNILGSAMGASRYQIAITNGMGLPSIKIRGSGRSQLAPTIHWSDWVSCPTTEAGICTLYNSQSNDPILCEYSKVGNIVLISGQNYNSEPLGAWGPKGTTVELTGLPYPTKDESSSVCVGFIHGEGEGTELIYRKSSTAFKWTFSTTGGSGCVYEIFLCYISSY